MQCFCLPFIYVYKRNVKLFVHVRALPIFYYFFYKHLNRNVQYAGETFMALSVHRAKCVTAAVRAVELPLSPATFMLPSFLPIPSSSPPPLSLFLLAFVLLTYLSNRDQRQIRFSRPRSSAMAICSLKQTLLAVCVAFLDGPVRVLPGRPGFLPLTDAAPSKTQSRERPVVCLISREIFRGPHRFPQI